MAVYPGLGLRPEKSRALLTEAGFPDGLSEVTIAEDILMQMVMCIQSRRQAPLRLYYLPSADSTSQAEGSRRSYG